MLILTALGVMAVTADNPLTLILLWAAIDLAELIAQLQMVEHPEQSERVVIAFASRVTGVLILLWANMVSAASGFPLDFRNAPPQTGLYLVLAAGLRLGVLPLHLPYTSETSLRRGFGTGLRMISAGSSLILATRIPSSSLASSFTPYLMLLISFAALYGAWMWLRAPDELIGRPFWMIGMGSLAFAAALRANPVGAAAWSLALILAGGALFLASAQTKWIERALLIGVWAISALPFSLSAAGWVSHGLGFWYTMPFLILAHAMLIAGLYRHIHRSSTRTPFDLQPLWARNLYPIGILILLLMIIGLSLIGWDGSLQLGNWLMGLSASLLAMGLFWLTPRLRILNPVRAHWVRPANPSWLDWLYRNLWNGYRLLSRFSNSLSGLLEGESGIMWTLLFLALFITFFTQRIP
jgi:ABC-type amino acid transport substrate-binding protein